MKQAQSKRNSKELSKAPQIEQPPTQNLQDQVHDAPQPEILTHTQPTAEDESHPTVKLPLDQRGLTIQVTDQHTKEQIVSSPRPHTKIDRTTTQKTGGIKGFKDTISTRYTDPKYQTSPASSPKAQAHTTVPTSPRASVSDNQLPISILEAMGRTKSDETPSEPLASSPASKLAPSLPSSPRGSVSKTQQKSSVHSTKLPRSSFSSSNNSGSLTEQENDQNPSPLSPSKTSTALSRGSLSKAASTSEQDGIKTNRDSASGPSYNSTAKRSSQSKPQKIEKKAKGSVAESAVASEDNQFQQHESQPTEMQYPQQNQANSFAEYISSITNPDMLALLQHQLTAHTEQVTINALSSKLGDIRLKLQEKLEQPKVTISFFCRPLDLSKLTEKEHELAKNKSKFIIKITEYIIKNFNKFFIEKSKLYTNNEHLLTESSDLATLTKANHQMEYLQKVKTLIEKEQITLFVHEKADFIEEFTKLYKDMINQCKNDPDIKNLYPEFGSLESENDGTGLHSWSIFMNDETKKEGETFALFTLEEPVVASAPLSEPTSSVVAAIEEKLLKEPDSGDVKDSKAQPLTKQATSSDQELSAPASPAPDQDSPPSSTPSSAASLNLNADAGTESSSPAQDASSSGEQGMIAPFSPPSPELHNIGSDVSTMGDNKYHDQYNNYSEG